MSSYREHETSNTSSDEGVGIVDMTTLSETSSEEEATIENTSQTISSSSRKTVDRHKTSIIDKRVNDIKAILKKVNIPTIVNYDNVETETYLVNKDSRIRNPSDVRKNVRKDTANFTTIMNHADIRFKYIKGRCWYFNYC